MIPGIAPNAEQTKSSYTEICTSALLIKTNNRTVTIKGNWSLVELISEPIHYNPNINGRFGAALIDTPETILALCDANRSQAQARLIRTSAERTRVCQEYYNTSVKMAKMKCTHFIHLLKGLQNKNIGRVSILTFEQFTQRAVHYGLRDAPLNENQYERLLKGITSQKPWQTLITWLCNNHHNRVSLRDLVKSAPIAGHKWY